MFTLVVEQIFLKGKFCRVENTHFCFFLSKAEENLFSLEAKAVNREDKLSRRYRDRDIAKFESSRRYRQR